MNSVTMKKLRTQNKEENNNFEEGLQVGKVEEVVEEEEERQKWSNPIEFLLSCIAMSVSFLSCIAMSVSFASFAPPCL